MTPLASQMNDNQYNRNMNAVKVENIPPHINNREVISLFNALVGNVRGSSDVKGMSGCHLEISFHTRDAVKKALCMSGYTIGGSPLIVTSIISSPDPQISAQSQDTRRNLYVLGLPYELTKNDLTAIFSRYGTVSHCVILATVDNSSRRRGFVVMSNHSEAKRAMGALTRSFIKGHKIDISWAIVQRSQGFLDGGDRTVFNDSRSARGSSPDGALDDNQVYRSANSSSDSSIGSGPNPSEAALLTASFVPSSRLLVSNLPTLLFSQTSDLHPLFYPFGHIKKFEVLESPQDTMTVIVEYSSVDSAKDAKQNLQGQCYANYEVRLEYMQSLTTCQDPDAAPYYNNNSNDSNNNRHDLDGRDLNFASTFGGRFEDSRSQFPFGMPSFCYQNNKHSNEFSNSPHYLLPQAHHPYEPASHPALSFSHNPTIWSRSSSSSSTWSNSSSQLPTPRSSRFASSDYHSHSNNTARSYLNAYDTRIPSNRSTPAQLQRAHSQGTSIASL